MKTKSSLYNTLSNLFVLSLSACILVSAISFESILHDLHGSILRRSLPGSLAFAPAGAIGFYEPPPGPIISEPLPTTADDSIVYDPEQEPGAVDNPDSFDKSRKEVALMAETDPRITAVPTGSASSGVVWSLTSLIASIFASMLHL